MIVIAIYWDREGEEENLTWELADRVAWEVAWIVREVIKWTVWIIRHQQVAAAVLVIIFTIGRPYIITIVVWLDIRRCCCPN